MVDRRDGLWYSVYHKRGPSELNWCFRMKGRFDASLDYWAGSAMGETADKTLPIF